MTGLEFDAAADPELAPLLVDDPPAEVAAAIAAEVDATGMLCPLPIVHLGKALRAAGAGDVVYVLATDPGFFPDLKRWIRVRSAALAALRQGPGDRYEAWVRND